MTPVSPFATARIVAGPSTTTVAPSERLAILPPGERERRGARRDRRRFDRRVKDIGSPYGVERRSGADDRVADRRGHRSARAGIGLTRDYFSQVAERAASDTPAIPATALVRFHD